MVHFNTDDFRIFATSMIYMGHVIDTMVDINKNTFLVKSKKRVYCFIANKVLVSFNSVIDIKIGNSYIYTFISQ